MILGGYCVEVPPLPIPNRVVKLNYADGTAVTCGRVGNRHFDAPREILGRFFVLENSLVQEKKIVNLKPKKKCISGF